MIDWPTMPAAPDPKPASRSLLERWRALAPASSPPRPTVEKVEPPVLPSRPIKRDEAPELPVTSEPMPQDPASWLRTIEAAIRATPPTVGADAVAAREHIILAVLEPIQRALDTPPDARNLAALTLAFARAEAILEALLLARP